MADSNEMTAKTNHPKFMPPKSRAIMAKGIKTSADIQDLIYATIDDVINERVTDLRGQTIFSGIGKSIGLAQLQLQYAKETGDIVRDGPKMLKGKP